jgi:hypothetical protein
MCNFLSALWTRAGKLICQPLYTDSHSELMAWAGIEERNTSAPVQQFVRLELLPPESTDEWVDTAKWQEKVDEHETPDWFDKASRFDAFEQMRSIIADAITDDAGRLTFGKLMILRKGANATVRGARVFSLGNSTVKALGNSTVEAWGNSTVKALGNSTVEALDNSTVKALGNSTVEAWGNSTVKALGNSTVEALDNRATVIDTRKPAAAAT